MPDNVSRPSTAQYREGWERIFQAAPAVATKPGTPATSYAVDVPAVAHMHVKSPLDVGCRWCYAVPGELCRNILTAEPMAHFHGFRIHAYEDKIRAEVCDS